MATYNRNKKLPKFKGKNGLEAQANFNNRVSKMLNNIQGLGSVDVIAKGDTIAIRGKPVANNITLPWTPILVNIDTREVSITHGAIDGEIPTIGGTLIDDDPRPILTLGATDNIIYIKGEMSWGSLSNFIIDSDVSLPPDDLVNGFYYFPIIIVNIDAGVIQGLTQVKTWNLNTIILCDGSIKTFPAG